MLLAIQKTLKIGKTIDREGRRSAGKCEKAGKALRYALINAQEPKSAGEAREGGSHSRREGGSPLKSARARKDFQSHFSRSL